MHFKETTHLYGEYIEVETDEMKNRTTNHVILYLQRYPKQIALDRTLNKNLYSHKNNLHKCILCQTNGKYQLHVDN